MPSTNGNRPNVYQIIYDAKSERTTVFIGDNPDPDLVVNIEKVIMLTTFSELNYYFNALADNIGKENVGITHVENGRERLDKIFIGKGGGSGTATIPPPPVITIINNVPNNAANQAQAYALEWSFDDEDNPVPHIYATTSYLGVPRYVPKIPHTQANTIAITALFNKNAQPLDYPYPNVDVYLVKDGVITQSFLNTGIYAFSATPNADYDTVIINEHLAPTPDSFINWQFTKTGSNNADFQIVDQTLSGTILAQVVSGALFQAGSFPVVAGHTIDIDASVLTIPAYVNAALKITNVTDSIIVFESSAMAFSYSFTPLAGKSYKIDFVTNSF